jgi:hypothetical protein
MTSITNGLTAGALVKVYGVPQADGTLRAYVVLYYTGDMPTGWGKIATPRAYRPAGARDMAKT